MLGRWDTEKSMGIVLLIFFFGRTPVGSPIMFCPNPGYVRVYLRYFRAPSSGAHL